MDQPISPDDIDVRIDGDGGTVTLADGAARLVLERRHAAAPPPADYRQLLLAERRATALVGREDELGHLRAWLDAASCVALRCLIGRGGIGKTRLAIELCGLAEAQGWTAGFLTHGELQRLHAEQDLAARHWNRDVLAVIDDAAASAGVLRAWLKRLAVRRPPGPHRLRLLLLERHAEAATGWWAELARPAESRSDGPDTLLDPEGPIRLASLRREQDRRALLTQAMQEAGRIGGLADPPVPPAPGADAAFDRRLGDDTIDNDPLYFIMAGIVAASSGENAVQQTRLELARRIAGLEQQRLAHLAERSGIDADRFVHLAACITLQGGCDREAGRRLIEDEGAAMGYGGEPGTDALMEALAGALAAPAGGGIDAVRPDLIGEAFLVRHITGKRRGKAEQLAIVARAHARAEGPVVQTVVRAAQDLAAGETAHPAVAWLGGVAAQCEDIGTLRGIADALPAHATALGEPAARILERIVQKLRPLAAADTEQAATLALSLVGYSNRLSNLGRREAALAPMQEAVGRYRALALARPDAFQPDLAVALETLSARLSGLGRHEAAVAAIEEAVGLFRVLAEARADAYRPALAHALNTLSSHLSRLGRPEAALAAVEEAVGIRRTLTRARPEAFGPDLASALNNLANRLSNLGRREAALAAIEEAAEVYRALAKARPEAFRPDLARALTDLSGRLATLGRHEAALAAIQEAADAYRALAEGQPEAFRPDLAAALDTLCAQFTGLGRHEAALAAIEEAVGVRRALALARPDVFRPDLASGLADLSGRLSGLGRREAALAAIEEAAGLYRALARARPDAYRPDLASALNALSVQLSGPGRREAALAAAEEAAGLYRVLARARPDGYRAGLAKALTTLSNNLSALGRHEAALAAIEEAVGIRSALAEARPGMFRSELAVAFWILADRRDRSDDRPGGLAANAEAIATLTEPFLKRPSAHAARMAGMVRGYRQRAERLGCQPDAALIEPIMPALGPFLDR